MKIHILAFFILCAQVAVAMQAGGGGGGGGPKGGGGPAPGPVYSWQDYSSMLSGTTANTTTTASQTYYPDRLTVNRAQKLKDKCSRASAAGLTAVPGC